MFSSHFPFLINRKKHTVFLQVFSYFIPTSITLKKDHLFPFFTHVYTKTVIQERSVIRNVGQFEVGWPRALWSCSPPPPQTYSHLYDLSSDLLWTPGAVGILGATHIPTMTCMTRWSHSSTKTSHNCVHSKLALASHWHHVHCFMNPSQAPLQLLL